MINDGQVNFINSREETGYIPFDRATDDTYSSLGFMCGLEIHQQLLTEDKLFCRCPAGIYQKGDDYDAELIRHMRPTLSELGEYDGTALMEFQTRKNIIYRIKDQTACTYDFDDTPPFPINREALDIAVEIGLLLGSNIVGELHITRKQYLDGSIPTGFQRTAIVGIEGHIPLSFGKVGIIQISIEEDSCREISDLGHDRTYSTDRLGMPLIEMVTYPDLKTPAQAAEAGHYLRFLARSSGKVRTGIGAARQDVNVSITGGQRVEIKGVAHIKWIPLLTHIEAFRQKALLKIAEKLNRKVADPNSWKMASVKVEKHRLPSDLFGTDSNRVYTALNLPGFHSILSHFTQPGKVFADEIGDRLKVVACMEKPNMTYSDSFEELPHFPRVNDRFWNEIKSEFKSTDDDAQILIYGPADDISTAIQTVEDRCRLAFEGVPDETRKSFSDGTTVFERVLPGANRMYPDTDSAPIPMADDYIETVRQALPISVDKRMKQLNNWKIPTDCHHFILKRNLVWIIEKITDDFSFPARFIGSLFGHTVKHFESRFPDTGFKYYTVYGLLKFIHGLAVEKELAREMMPVLFSHPNMEFDSVLTTVGYQKISEEKIYSFIPALHQKYAEIGRTNTDMAKTDWIMGQLRRSALGNMPLGRLRERVEERLQNV